MAQFCRGKYFSEKDKHSIILENRGEQPLKVGDIVYTKFLNKACTRGTRAKIVEIDLDENKIDLSTTIIVKGICRENKIGDFLTDSYSEITPSVLMIRPRIRCNDGFEMSVQASCMHYCTPRKNLENGLLYTHVEIGYPNIAESLIEQYAKNRGDLTDSVYANVPIEVVNEVVEKHGGLISDLPRINERTKNYEYCNYYGTPMKERYYDYVK